MLAFDRPWALALLALVPVLAALRRFLRSSWGSIAFPIDGAGPLAAPGATPLAAPSAPPGATPFVARSLRAARGLALWLGLAATALAAAGPAIVDRRTLYLSRGNEVVFVLDVSPSMAASDFAPTRLDAAKAIIGDFLAKRRNETVGLVAFGGEAALACPPTMDYAALAARLAAQEPGSFGEGTAIGAGIAVAVAHVARSGAPEKHIVLLTDGENNAGSIDPEAAAQAAARYSIYLSVIGIGSRGDVPLVYVDPATGAARKGTYRSDFDRAPLESLARTGGGLYYAAEDADSLVAAFESLSERSASLARTRSVATEEGLGSVFLAAGLACLALARLLGIAGGGGRP